MWLWRARIRLLRHYCNVICVWSQVFEHMIGITKDSNILTWNRNDGRSSKRLRAPLQPRIFTIFIGVEINSQIAWCSYCSSLTAWQASLTWLFISVDGWTVSACQIISPLSGWKKKTCLKNIQVLFQNLNFLPRQHSKTLKPCNTMLPAKILCSGQILSSTKQHSRWCLSIYFIQ